MPFVRVALDVPVAELFDYRVDDGADCVGRRVAVPFGRRHVTGVVVEISESSSFDAARIKSAVVLRDLPSLSAAWLGLMRFCAGYYQHPLGQAIMASLPLRLKQARAIDQSLWRRYVWQEIGRAHV